MKKTFDEIFAARMFPICDYGKEDPIIKKALVLKQLLVYSNSRVLPQLQQNVQSAINKNSIS